MRITYNFMTMKYLNGMNSTLNNLVKSSEQVTKGRSLLNPEDDPTKYLSAFNIQRSVDDAAQYNRNSNNALIWLQNEDNVLQTASSILSRAKDELAIQGANDTQDADSRKALAGEVQNIYEEMLDLANSEYLDRYLFGGYETDNQPFTSGERNVSAVMSNMDGGQAFSARLYGDMPELNKGTYDITAVVKNGVTHVSMRDENSRTVLLDSNGSDETTENGNLTSDTLTTEFAPGQVINTGRGVSIQLPDDMVEGNTLTLSLNYVPGDSVSYVGDDGEIQTKIGANQSVTINVAGQDIFMETYRTVQGTMSNTMNDVNITSTSPFSALDGANVSEADSISFTGTDHNGYLIGTARVSSPGNVKLDMSNTTDEQRTITLTYGRKDYELVMDEEGYSGMDEIIFNLNRQIDNAGIGAEVNAVNDGDKVMFMTTRAGNGVELSVTGSEYNTLGFLSIPIEGVGKDNIFELMYDNYNGPVETVHSDLSIAPGTHNYFVNGTELEITVGAADGASEIEDHINKALEDEGLGFDVAASVTNGSVAGSYNVTYALVNQNYSKDTYLATRDDLGTADSYQYSTAKGFDYPTSKENRVSDMLNFIEDLYGNAVDATVVNGKIQVRDLRSGDSRLTFSIDELNTGVGYPMLEPNVTFDGRYTGTVDESWSVDVSVVSGNITLKVADSRGNILSDNSANPIVADNYNGEPVYLAQGVSMVIGEVTSSTSFSIDMTAYSNLSFGDMNVIEEGENVNVFQSLKNLHDALDKNIPESGVGAPSAWRDASLNSSAVPYFDGEFRGNYNDELTFEVEYYNSESEFYLQSEQYWESQPMRGYADIDVDIDLMLKSDQTDPEITFKNYTVAAGVYSASTTLLVADLITQINSDASLKSLGVQAYSENGKLRIDSGSGNTEISVNYNTPETALIFGQTVSDPASATQLPNLEFTEDSRLNIMFHTPSGWSSLASPVTISAGSSYATTDALLSDINSQLSTLLPAALTTPANGLGTNSIVAEQNNNGTLKFKEYGTVDDIVVSGDDNGELGFYRVVPENTVLAKGRPTLDVSEKTIAERTLTFSYNDGVNDLTSSILVDKENYQSLEDLIENINTQISDEGISGVSCVKVGEDKLGFYYDSSVIDSLHVSGDYAGTFGIEMGGDIAKVKVSSSDGTLINNYTMHTSNQSYYVVDGVYHHYDAGYLYATDSYTVAVGSGINHEIGVLGKAESQIHTSLTTVGNRVGRTESALSFNESMITLNDEIKAQYTGSTTIDQSRAATNYTTAQTVYQAALSSTASILKISLMDYL
ncbi:MAG: hypothetical protein C0602_01590 [Denitrovibrio sp.]|nr:MAG: hypothetical protein C0602_01590 [Denitrovibrio sp.]